MSNLTRLRFGLFVLVLWLSLFNSPAFGAWSCAATEPNCRSAFIVYSPWHAAIVLRKDEISSDKIPELDDFPRARFIEFSWGDKDYFPDPGAGVFAALRAAFWSSGSVLHLVGFDTEVASFYPGAKIIDLGLSPSAYARLMDYISETFFRPFSERRARPSAGLFVNSHFYLAARKFSLARTCNTWVAEALESAGLPIEPSYVITAAQLAEQIGEANESK